MKKILALVFIMVLLPITAAQAKNSEGTLTVSPNPVAVGEDINVNGCGFPDEVTVGVETPAYTGTTALATNGGCFYLRWNADSGAGEYKFTVYNRIDHGGSIRLVELNQASTVAN